MMILLLTKKNPSILSYRSIPLFLPRITIDLHLLQSFSSSASASQNPSQKSNFITDYLITSCGLSPQKAARASKDIPRLASSSKPDSVRHFFKHVGFIDTQISTLITNCPRILHIDVDKTLQPNLQALYKFGLAEHELRKLIIYNPQVLTSPFAISRLDFWKSFLNGDKKQLLSAFTTNRNLITCNIDKNVVAKISLLKDYGFSNSEIAWIVVRRNLIKRSIASMEVLLKRAQQIGFQLGSTMFLHGLWTLSCLRADLFTSRMELFYSFGWSEEEFLSAFRKSPYFTHLAEENIKEKMEFLVGTVGCTQSYIASCPMILAYSLERRLMPRHHVMKFLKSNKLISRDLGFYNVVAIPEKKFMDRFILQYKDKAPRLLETYIASCPG